MELTKENFKEYMTIALSFDQDCKLFCNVSPYLVAIKEMVEDLTTINENQDLTPGQKLEAFQSYLILQQELLSFADSNYKKVAEEVADPEIYGYPFLQETDSDHGFEGDYPLENYSKLGW